MIASQKQTQSMWSQHHMHRYLSTSAKQTSGTVCSSEGNNCTPATDSLRDSRSCYQQNMLAQSIYCTDQIPQCDSSRDIKPSLAYSKLDSNDSLCSEVQLTSSEGPKIDSEMELDTDDALTAREALLLHVGGECDHDYRSAECSPMNLAAPSPCVDQEARAANLIEKADIADGRTESHHSSTEERRPIISQEQNTEDKIEFDTKLSSSEGVSNIEMNKSAGRSRTNTVSKDHLKNLVPFTEEWLAVMEAFGEEVLEQKTGAVQNSPTDKAAPEPSPWLNGKLKMLGRSTVPSAPRASEQVIPLDSSRWPWPRLEVRAEHESLSCN